MELIRKILLIWKNIFSKKETVKMIEAPVEKEDKKSEFMKKIKTDTVRRKKKVETQVNDGDGLGIQYKIDY